MTAMTAKMTMIEMRQDNPYDSNKIIIITIIIIIIILIIMYKEMCHWEFLTKSKTGHCKQECERDRISLYSLPTPSIRVVPNYVNIVTPSTTVELVIDFYSSTIWAVRCQLRCLELPRNRMNNLHEYPSLLKALSPVHISPMFMKMMANANLRSDNLVTFLR
jgi:hypothetical protein